MQAIAPPLLSGRLFLSISIIGLSCIHLSVDAPWYEVAGHRGTEAFPLQVPSLPIFPPLFFFSAIILFFWALFISFAHLARPQTNTCRHTYYAHINCGLSHTWIRVHAHMLFCFHYFKGHCISLDFHFLNAYYNPTYRTTWLTLNIPVILT